MCSVPLGGGGGGGCSVPWGVQYCSDIMMHVGDILSMVGDLQYHGGHHDNCGDILSTVGIS